MAFLFADSADHYGTAQITDKWTSLEADGGSTGSIEVDAGVGLDASDAIRFGVFLRIYGGPVIGLTPGDNTCIVGIHYYADNAIDGPIACVRKSGVTQCALFLRSDGKVELRAGDTTGSTLIAASAAGAVALDAWHYIALEVTVGNSNAYEVAVNGASVFSGTGDTQATANTGWDSVHIRSYGTNSTVWNAWFDEVFIWDGTGSTNNALPVDHRVECGFPTSDGTHTAWTKSTGSNAYALVDEAAPSDADYVYTATAGAKQSLTFPAPTSDPIAGIQLCAWLRADVAGVRQVRGGLRIGGTNYPHSTTVTVGADDLYYRWIWEENPDTVAAFELADFPLEAYLECVA